MTNKTTKAKKWSNLTWISESTKDRMRIDMTGVFDVPIATYIKNKEGTHLWLFRKRQYFFSKDGGKLFRRLAHISMDPQVFYHLLGQPKGLNPHWSCKEQKAVLNCVGKKENLRLSVKFPKGNQRLIAIESKAEALRIRLSRSKLQIQDKIFQPLSTPSFEIIKL